MQKQKHWKFELDITRIFFHMKPWGENNIFLQSPDSSPAEPLGPLQAYSKLQASRIYKNIDENNNTKYISTK